MAGPRLAIVIPALNEARTIAAVVERSLPFGMPIVVDDGSSDGTAQIAQDAGATVVLLPVNRGYDGALDAGFERAAALGCSYVVTMDADGQHNPDLLADFIRRLETSADIVVGIRSRRQRVSEHVFAWVARSMYGLQDPLCGMKGYRIEVYRRLGHFDSYGSIGTELALFALKNGYRCEQVPVAVREREGQPRFDRILRANLRIFRAMLLSFTRLKRV